MTAGLEQLQQKLQNPGYTNWIRCTLALVITKEALHEYMANKYTGFHYSLLQSCDMNHLTKVHNTTTCQYRIKYNRARKKWEIDTSCSVYDILFQLVLSLHVNPTSDKIYWSNAKLDSFLQNNWTIAKVFMPRGNEKCNQPTDTDATALFNVLNSCTLFRPIDNQLLDEVIQGRNDLMHSSDNTVSNDEMKQYFVLLERFLEFDNWGEGGDTSLKDRKECKTATEAIRKITNADFKLSLTLEQKALDTQLKALDGDINKALTNRIDDINTTEDFHKDDVSKTNMNRNDDINKTDSIHNYDINTEEDNRKDARHLKDIRSKHIQTRIVGLQEQKEQLEKIRTVPRDPIPEAANATIPVLGNSKCRQSTDVLDAIRQQQVDHDKFILLNTEVDLLKIKNEELARNDTRYKSDDLLSQIMTNGENEGNLLTNEGIWRKGYQHDVQSESVGTTQPSTQQIVNQDHNDNTSKDNSLLSKGSTELLSLSHKTEDSGNSENDSRSSNGVQNNLFALLKRFELTQWFPGKISQKDVTAIDVNERLSETKCISNLPWLILKRLIMANTQARDSTVDELVHGHNDNSSTDDDDSEGSEETDELCPLDVFIALFHCCDSLLKQSIYKKMFMCRFAVPLLYKEYSSGTFIVPVWPLRPIVVEWMDSKRKSNEDFIIDQQTKIIAFARFGRPKYSKSKLQNDLLSDHKHDTFFNKDCPSGMSERSLSIGYVEASWYLPGGNVSDVFDEVLTFANVRGDLLNDFSENQIKFIQSLATMFVIVIDIQSFRKNINRVMQFLEALQSLVLILTPTDNEKDTDLNECARELKEKTGTKGKEVHIVLTYKKRKERNASDMKKTLSAHIDTCLKKTRSTQLSVCFEQLSEFEIRSDEEDPECKAGKCLAESLFDSILKSGPQEDWKSAVTPLQYTYWRKWSKLKKKLQRSFNHIHDTELIKCQMNDLRRSQLQMVSETMKLFIKIFVKHVDQKHTILYFIEWLKLFLDNMSRGLLPAMRRNYNIAWDNLKQMESESEVKSEAVSNQFKIVKRLEESLDGVSFGIEHLFREMSQIYEAELSANKSNRNIQEITNISKAMAKLISYGQPLELLDGDAFNIPTDWVNSVLVAVKDLIGCERIMTLSVLGIQSSGKSTLLNTMFGLQFAVSAGRCTRGVYMQLIPIAKSSGLPFDHVMVIDSEGLRAPKLLEQKKDHDNELATFVIGLGDITLLNIKGENTSEINDILQITVHAFLRLKPSNRKLDLRQICIFVHQNVAAINAADKMKHGVQKLVKCLDTMTTEAAYVENIHDITCFNQVIQFNGTMHVWYLPDLWQGDPPMAAANVGYSTKVKDLRTSILQIAISEKSYKCMDDILIHTKDLWKGICAEDFVFSFKNSLEIKAYLLMETKYKQLAWQLESFAQVETQEISKTAFRKCQSDDDVETTSATVLKLLLENVEAKYYQLKTQLDFFFENCDYQDIIINWKQTKHMTFLFFFENLNHSIQKEIMLYASNRKVQIVLISSRQQQEERLHQESIKLASYLKGKYMSTTEINKEFERIWDIFIQGIKHETETNFKPVKAICIEILCKIFNTDTSALYAQLEHYNDLDKDLKIEKLHGSSNSIGLKVNDDISIHISERVHYWVKGKHAKDQLVDITNLLFRETDVKIGHILQEDNKLVHRHVSNLLQYVTGLIDDTVKSNNSTWGFTLKTSYRVKICVFISCYAQRKFELHNQEYRKSHGIKVQLIRYKAQVRSRFEAYLQDRKAEATAANLFSTEVEGFIIENVSERLTLKVEHSLMAFFPNLKYHLIIEILTDLVEKGCFKQFIEYIRHPTTFADALNTEKASDYLFGQKRHKYVDLALNEISLIISDIRSGIHKASEQCNTSHSICDWIAFFYDSLSHCTIERGRLREVEREKVVDFAIFKNYLESEMNNVEASVKQVFVKHTMASVKWKTNNPLTTVFDRIWGCTETCVFCGEICARSSDHVGSTSHSCIQHRPAGVNGVHTPESKEISLTSCNFKIQSDEICECSHFSYLCNPTEHVECSKGVHPYKEYRTYLPSWDIEPGSDMEDTCKLWLWFIAKYRHELASHYKYNINNIPDSWQRITKEEALESLRHMF